MDLPKTILFVRVIRGKSPSAGGKSLVFFVSLSADRQVCGKQNSPQAIKITMFVVLQQRRLGGTFMV